MDLAHAFVDVGVVDGAHQGGLLGSFEHVLLDVFDGEVVLDVLVVLGPDAHVRHPHCEPLFVRLGFLHVNQERNTVQGVLAREMLHEIGVQVHALHYHRFMRGNVPVDYWFQVFLYLRALYFVTSQVFLQLVEVGVGGVVLEDFAALVGRAEQNRHVSFADVTTHDVAD